MRACLKWWLFLWVDTNTFEDLMKKTPPLLTLSLWYPPLPPPSTEPRQPHLRRVRHCLRDCGQTDRQHRFGAASCPAAHNFVFFKFKTR